MDHAYAHVVKLSASFYDMHIILERIRRDVHHLGEQKVASPLLF